jgi:hypothetical protein
LKYSQFHRHLLKEKHRHRARRQIMVYIKKDGPHIEDIS